MVKEMEFVANSAWWATADFPVHDVSRTAFLIDGRMTMLEMCCRFLCAQKSVHIAAWGMTPELLMVRGKHHQAGPTGSPEQEELLSWLRSKGLGEQDVLFWQTCEELSVKNVLSYLVAKGVEVRVLLWDRPAVPFLAGPKQIKETFDEIGVQCLLDDSCLSLEHPIASLHQKMTTIDGRIAFVGGIDLMYESDGEYDRWDTKGHMFDNSLRRRKNGQISHSWHDLHTVFEGSAVADVECNFCQRWNSVIERKGLEDLPLLPLEAVETPTKPPQQEKILMQVIRTIPRSTYAFTPENGIATILEAYQKAFKQAKRSIYIENQYLWRRTYLGLETPLLGLTTEVMDELFHTLAEAMARGVVVTIVLPDNPNVGRDFSDDGLQYLWELAPLAVASGALQVYTLASSVQKNGDIYYRPIYVHAKVAIVDDQWVTIGSANLNNRGMRDDAELNVALLHPSVARGLRILLMAEHLGLVDEDTLFRIVEVMGCTDPTMRLATMDDTLQAEWQSLQRLLSDPFVAMTHFLQQAKGNLEAIRNRQLLNGHIVPYVRQSMAQDYGLEVDAVNGWLHKLNPVDLPLDAPDTEAEDNTNEVSAT